MIFFRRTASLLAPGTMAPGFELLDQHGQTVRSADLRGRRVLLWFYPKANTPGCSIEGKGFCARAPGLAPDLVVLGVSFDPPEANRAFAEKFGFPFRLLSDSSRSVAVAYGAATSPKARWPDRISYVIDAQGRIEWAARSGTLAISAHVEEALAALERRGSETP